MCAQRGINSPLELSPKSQGPAWHAKSMLNPNFIATQQMRVMVNTPPIRSFLFFLDKFSLQSPLKRVASGNLSLSF